MNIFSYLAKNTSITFTEWRFVMENFAKKLALEHNVQGRMAKKHYPVIELRNDIKIISKAYDILQESIFLDVPIPPSGEWLLDNFYIIEEQADCIEKELKIKECLRLPAIHHKLRIFELSNELVTYTDANITSENVQRFINSYTTKRKLSMQEIWLLPTMLKISLIHYIREIAEKIISTQYQKFKVSSLVERLIKNKNSNQQVFAEYKSINLNGEISSYVEYLVYLLKREGKTAKKYLNFLTEEIKKAGTTLDDVIQIEHFEMALRRVSMSNSITSIKNILRYNWTDIFENINGIDMILSRDEWYEKSDFDTKNMYRNEIQEIGRKTKLSESYIASKVVELAIKENEHIGEFLIGESKYKLYDFLGFKVNKEKSIAQKLFVYISCIYIPTVIISLLLLDKYFWIGIIPISEVFVLLINRVITKVKKPRILARLKDIPKDVSTFVIVPTLINSKERVSQIIKNLEVFFLANKIPNLYFALLGDASEEKTEYMAFDDEVKETGINEVNRLNEKYGEERFFFLYRKRVFNKSQNRWLGYERKRGMITEFTDFLLYGNQGTFCINTIKNLPEIKYIITLDSDTIIPMDTAQKLIGTLEHPLNKPVVSGKTVTKGYALIQPKVGISMDSSTASSFSKIFAGDGGIDCYSIAESNIYQDLFGEAIFTGKGIFNVEIFNKLLKKEIPENTVLSHDLLEGSYLRCGLASDIEVIDGFPARVNSYMLRLHRWTRGDWQICKWLFKGPLNSLSRYKILDNLRRSLSDIFLLAMIFCGRYVESIFIIFFPFIFDLIGKIYAHQTGIKLKNYLPIVNGLKGSFLRCFLALVFLPYKAFLMLKAIVVTLYRVIISKKNLLEWITAADSEKLLGQTFGSYIKAMSSSVIIGIIVFALSFFKDSMSIFFSSILLCIWVLAPFVAYLISQTEKNDNESIANDKRENILDVAKRTWNYFDDYMTEENNFLPPDNYQLGRKNIITITTSSTNIGLGLLTIISAYDLKFIEIEECISKLKNSIDVIEKLKKWNGHLYNWYNIQTLEPLTPEFISTVDSGNYVGYLYVVKKFLEKNSEYEYSDKVQALIENTDFSKLYAFDKNLFSIGFDVRENKLIDSYYDLLASESRLASFVAISKRDVPYKHWFSLSRALTTVDRYKGLVSWSGTMFEYFMPFIVMNKYRYTLIDESYDFCIYSQKKYAKKLDIPWGISESAFNLQDLNLNYQYKAFGIPWLGLKRGLKDEIVVAPYSSILAINFAPNEVYKNLEKLKEIGAYDKYGFYDAIDYTPGRVDKRGYSLVKTYMAHHQALILISINNFLNKLVMQERFLENPEIKAVDLLLQERVPTEVVLTKKKKEKIKVLKYKNYEEYTESSQTENIGNVNIQSNNNYTLVINDNGEGYASLDNLLLTKNNDKIKSGNFVYIKNLESGEVITNTSYPIYDENARYEVKFSPAQAKFYCQTSDIEVSTKIAISPEENLEVREITIKNISQNEMNLDIMSYVEPVISHRNNDIVHPAYNNLFFRAERYENSIVLEKKSHEGSIYYINFFVCEDENVEFELDKSKIIGRLNDVKRPVILNQDVAYQNEAMVSTSTIISFKKNIKLDIGETKKIVYYYGVSKNYRELIDFYNKYRTIEDNKRLFEMAYSKSLVENRFLGYKGKDILLYNKLFAVLQNNKTREKHIERIKRNVLKQHNLWRFGVSGDLPIVLIKISRVNDIYVVKDLMLGIEYFNKKKLYTDLIILNNEENKYEQYVQDKIYEAISAKGLNYLINKNGGIHIIKRNDITDDEENLLLSCSNLILNAEDGFLREQLYE